MLRIEPSAVHQLMLRVNGLEYAVSVPARRLLCDVLREDIGLTGTHVGCEHGICGSCTVLIDGKSARSCLTFAVQCSGREITTVEGLGRDGALSALQQTFHEHHALQCGFCTPGMLLAAQEFLDSLDPAEAVDGPAVRRVLAGHICRCTGYQNIVAAVLAAASARG